MGRSSDAWGDRAALAASDELTHSCDGCTGGRPCHDCGGGVSRTGPAYAALDWAVRSARARGPVTGFWDLALINHKFHAAAPRERSDDWTVLGGITTKALLVEELVRDAHGGSDLGGGVMSGQAPSRFVAAPWPDPAPKPDPEPIDEKLREIPQDVKDIIAEAQKRMKLRSSKTPRGGFRKCCILESGYPKKVYKPEYVGTPTLVEKGGYDWQLGVKRRFDFTLRYSQFQPCDCLCCEFIQIVVRNEVKFRPLEDAAPFPKSKGVPPTPPGKVKTPHEDTCTFYVPSIDPNTNQPRTGSDGKSLYNRERHERDWTAPAGTVGPVCYGDRAPADIGVIKDPEPPSYKDQCRVNTYDSPSTTVYGGYNFTWYWESWFVVFDTCHNAKVEDVFTMAWRVVGTLPVVPASKEKLEKALMGGPATEGTVELGKDLTGR